MKIDDEKSLVEKNSKKINGSSFKYFIKKIIDFFYRKKNTNIEITPNDIQEKKNSFIDSLKVDESEEMKLLNLQKKYRSGEIKEESLTEEQIAKLIELYDEQIKNKEKQNEIKRAKIAKLKASN